MFCLDCVPGPAGVKGVSLHQVHLYLVSPSSPALYLRSLRFCQALLDHWLACSCALSVIFVDVSIPIIVALPFVHRSLFVNIFVFLVLLFVFVLLHIWIFLCVFSWTLSLQALLVSSIAFSWRLAASDFSLYFVGVIFLKKCFCKHTFSEPSSLEILKHYLIRSEPNIQ